MSVLQPHVDLLGQRFLEHIHVYDLGPRKWGGQLFRSGGRDQDFRVDEVGAAYGVCDKEPDGGFLWDIGLERKEMDAVYRVELLLRLPRALGHETASGRRASYGPVDMGEDLRPFDRPIVLKDDPGL